MAQAPDKKFAFVKMGRFSNINEKVLAVLRHEFPGWQIEVIDVWADLISPRDPASLLCCLKDYLPEIVTGKKEWRNCLSRTPYFFNRLKRRLAERVAGKGFAFSLQTQSMFDGSVPGTPHFVYTDHTHLANLQYPGFSQSQLFSQAWIALEKTIYHNARFNFTMSSNIARSIREDYGCPAEKVLTIFGGSNSQAPDPALLPDRRYAARNILFVGVEWERKGGPQLVKAFETVVKKIPDAQLTIVGCAPKLNAPNCRVVGKVALSEVSKFYQEASVFCLPTRNEPFGVVFVEAFAHKLPIVSTPIGALPDIVSEGENGFLVPCNDTDALAQRLIELLGDPARCRRFGEHGYLATKDKYTWEATGHRLAENIRRLL